ncbi:TPA: hypothetical protein PTV74_002126 [Clostridium botulinum]|nr:hypothetical protein [Clostridium botulinum]HDK7193295.1 hypothetical protein [Clostridium botulinum]HDK7205145.1 hypothetical protein [Clostridium botulinum]HDK7209165.1 hypothetical protein [Clostridium botulinum]HDK7264325.1 hypothetical protein [Clostridium botulinum]
MSNGIDTDVNSGDLNGGIVTDIIIDTGFNGDIEGAIVEIEKILSAIN